MKVHELMELLSALPQNAELWVSSDPEGNSFNRLACAEEEYMSVDMEPIHPDDLDDYDEDEVTLAVVLWP